MVTSTHHGLERETCSSQGLEQVPGGLWELQACTPLTFFLMLFRLARPAPAYIRGSVCSPAGKHSLRAYCILGAVLRLGGYNSQAWPYSK